MAKLLLASSFGKGACAGYNLSGAVTSSDETNALFLERFQRGMYGTKGRCVVSVASAHAIACFAFDARIADCFVDASTRCTTAEMRTLSRARSRTMTVGTNRTESRAVVMGSTIPRPRPKRTYWTQ